MIAGLAEVMSRIQDIQNRFPTVPAFGYATGTNFAAALTSALNSSGVSSAGTNVVTAASRYLGVPYTWGGTNPATGFDCSGFVQRVYGDLGYQLPRVASDQAKAGTPVASLADAQPGDLVAFGTPVDHIGIYVGDGKMMDAPHPGAVVRIEQITDQPTAIRRITDSTQAVAPGFAAFEAGLGLSSALSSTSGVGVSSTAGGFGAIFDSATARYGLPSGLLAAVARAESNYNPSAVSPAGALGMMQLMPGTARSLGVDPFNPTEAVDAAARLLSGGLSRFGTVPLALAAYNAGDSTVSKYGGIPPYPQTQAYIKTVMDYMKESR